MTNDTTNPVLYILAPQKNRTILSGPAFRYMTSTDAYRLFSGQRSDASPPKTKTGSGKSD